MISIVIPVFNRAELLKRTLHSFLNQALRNCEIIVVDDGSTHADSIKLVIDQFRTIAPEISVHLEKLSVNCGQMQARAIGIEKASKDWIMLFDSDDEILPGGLGLIMKTLENANPLVHVMGFECSRELREAGSSSRPLFTIDNVSNYIRWLENPTRVSDYTMCYRKEVFEKVDFVVERISEIWWFLRLLRNFGIVYHPIAVTLYHSDAPDQLSKRRLSWLDKASEADRKSFISTVKHWRQWHKSFRDLAPHHGIAWARHLAKGIFRGRHYSMVWEIFLELGYYFILFNLQTLKKRRGTQ